MKAQTARILMIGAAFLVGAVLCFGAILMITNRSGISVATAGATVGGPFDLVDESGKEVTNRDMLGHPYLVFFGYTHCPDVCPTTLFEMTEVFNKLGPDANRVGALFITVDPERDTAPVMKDYMSSFDPHMHGLTGSPAAIATTLKEFRVYAKKVPTEGGDYSMDHSAIVYLMDKDGQFVAPFNMKRKPDEAAADLRKYL